MKKFLFGSMALIALGMSAPAMAADMPVKAPPPVAVAVATWTGCYIGANIGLAHGKFKNSEVRQVSPVTGLVTVVFDNFDYDENGIVGGGQIGCNWQSGTWVLGVETDFQGTSIDAQRYFDNAIFSNPSAAFDTDVDSKLRYFGTVRARAGITVTPATLLYVTGGFAYGRVKHSLHFPTAAGTPTAFRADASANHTGWTVGGGGEMRLGNNWSVKLEYLYIDLGENTNLLPCMCADNARWKTDLQVHTVRFGVNYQFNWAGPVVARN